MPANPMPKSLQYVTVYDNGDQGGFAGSKPVSAPETFRCGFMKLQGQSQPRRGEALPALSQVVHEQFTAA